MYKTMNDGYIQRDSDLAIFGPLSPDYTKYLADVAKGASVTPFDYAAEAVRQAPSVKERHNAPIREKMDKADLKIIRALAEGDTARIAAHKTAQAELRATLKP